METEQNKSRAVENSNKLAKELKMVQVHHTLLCKYEKYLFGVRTNWVNSIRNVPFCHLVIEKFKMTQEVYWTVLILFHKYMYIKTFNVQ